MTNEEIDKMMQDRAKCGCEDTKSMIDAGMRDLSFQAAIANSMQTIAYVLAEAVKRMEWRAPVGWDPDKEYRCTHDSWRLIPYSRKQSCTTCGLMIDCIDEEGKLR